MDRDLMADLFANLFVKYYYHAFDFCVAKLLSIYGDESILTFEGKETQGAQAIVAKFISLPYQQCRHSISTIEWQHSGPDGGVLISVSGSLEFAGEPRKLKFSQTFNVMPKGGRSFCVLNDSFQLDHA